MSAFSPFVFTAITDNVRAEVCDFLSLFVILLLLGFIFSPHCVDFVEHFQEVHSVLSVVFRVCLCWILLQLL